MTIIYRTPAEAEAAAALPTAPARPWGMPAHLPDEFIPEYTACPHCHAQPGAPCADTCEITDAYAVAC